MIPLLLIALTAVDAPKVLQKDENLLYRPV
jgi:hypothetical protein